MNTNSSPVSNPKFAGVWIPKDVLEAPVSLSAKIAYGVLSGLDNEDGCFASNGYLATLLGISERSVRAVLQELEGRNLITRLTENGTRIIRTVEKQALELAYAKTLGEEENFRRGRQKTATRGGRKLPPYSIEDNIDDSKRTWVPPVLPFSSMEFINAWNLWVDYRKEIKKPIRKTTINAQFDIFKAWGEAKTVVSIKNSIANGWVGLFEPKGTNAPLTANDHSKF